MFSFAQNFEAFELFNRNLLFLLWVDAIFSFPQFYSPNFPLQFLAFPISIHIFFRAVVVDIRLLCFKSGISLFDKMNRILFDRLIADIRDVFTGTWVFMEIVGLGEGSGVEW